MVVPEDPGALAEALEYVLTHSDEARRIGEAGRRRVEEHFSIESMVTKHIAVYDSLVAPSGACGGSLEARCRNNGGPTGE